MARKAAQATPNHLLRRARQEQGWTQKVVADRIGAPHDIMVTRWERGTVFPSAYYVERLCQLFGKHASELGLLQESSNQKAVERPHVNSTRFSSPEDLARPAGNTPTIQAVQQDSPTALISQLSLTGRDQEYHALVEAYQVVQRGQTRVVIIQGEAGIGKTRLAREFLSWVAEQGADVLLGRAFEAGGRLPYQALVDALRDHLEGENELSTSWLAELSRLFPELRDRYPDLSVPTADETSAHIRLFEAITRLMQVWAEHAPVVLFLDDLQWADAASLDLLQYALRRWTTSQTPLLLLASVRLEALHAAGSLLHWKEAISYARQALDPQEPNFALCGRLSRWYEIEALVRAGETERAAENVRRFGESIGTSQRYRIPYLRALAILAEHRGKFDLATQHLQEAARLAEEIGLPGELWSIQAEVGELYLKQGETEQAADAFKTGAALMQKLANTVEDDAQRATFLGSPAVQQVLK